MATADATATAGVRTETLELTQGLQAPEVSGGNVVVAVGSAWATAYDDVVRYRVALEP